MSSKDALEDQVKDLNNQIADKIKQLITKKPAGAMDGTSLSLAKFSRFGKGVKQDGKLNGISWLGDAHLAIATQDGKSIVYDIKVKADGMRWFECVSSWLNTLSANRFTLKTDQTKLAVGGLDNTVTVYDVSMKTIEEGGAPPENASKKEFQKHGGPIYSIEWFSQTGVLSGSGDTAVMQWDLGQKGNVVKDPIRTFSAFTADVNGIVSYDENTFVASSSDKTVKLFDMRTSGTGVVRSFCGHLRACTGLKKHPSNGAFATSSEDGTVRMWDIKSGGQVACYGTTWVEPDDEKTENDTLAATALEFTQSGGLMMVGYGDGSMKMYDVAKGEECAPLPKEFSHGARVTGIELSPDGFAMASCSREETKTNNFAIWA